MKLKPFQDPTLLQNVQSSNHDNLQIEMDEYLVHSSNLKAFTLITLLVLEFICLTYTSHYLWTTYSYWLMIIPFILWGGISNQCIIILHECSHGFFIRPRKLNNFIGTLFGAFVGLSFKSFTKAHMLHHKENGQESDMEIRGFLNLDTPKDIFKYLLKPPLLFNSTSPPTSKKTTKSGPPILGYTAILHTCIIATQVLVFNTSTLPAILFTLSVPTTALILRKTRVLSEHAVESPNETFITRSHAPNIFDAYFYNAFGMNWHREHHLYPNVPGYQLKHIHKRMQELSHPLYQKASPSVLLTLLKIIRK